MNIATTAAAKRAAVEQWTADPCGPDSAAKPGTRAHIQDLLIGRHEYAPWMGEVFGYEGWAGRPVLDVGSGQGIDLVRYALGGARVTGVDLTERHVELARAHLQAMALPGDVVLGDAEALPFGDETFDRVSSNGVLHHTPSIEAALAEMRRVLRPGGEAVVVVYHRDSLHFWLDQVVRYGILRGGLLRERSLSAVLSSVERSSIGARPQVRVYGRRQVRRLLEEAGFADVRVGARHLRPSDTFLTARLARRFERWRDPRTLDRVGRIAGWYVVARARR